MKFKLSQEQKDELEKIGDLYRKTIYDSSLVTLPSIIEAFIDGLKELDGDISSSIAGEVYRFYKLASSDYSSTMCNIIGDLHNTLSESLPTDISFVIICRQKSWESVLRKILKYYFAGQSVVLADLVALRIIIDSNCSEEQQEEICHNLSSLVVRFFTQKELCTLMPPAKRVANNPLLKDYICHPKSNGYKSIHLAFMDINNNIFEVQIRTQLMNAHAEFGAQDETFSGFETIEKLDEDNVENFPNHTTYKIDEYESIIPYIFFDVEKAARPLFRVYKWYNPNLKHVQFKVIDKIGLLYAKPIEEISRTF